MDRDRVALAFALKLVDKCEDIETAHCERARIMREAYVLADAFLGAHDAALSAPPRIVPPAREGAQGDLR